MDEIDIALTRAWFDLSNRLQHDPEEADRRAARAARALRNPVAPWCLRIRACDTRIDDWTIITDDGRDALRRAQPHDIGLNKWILESLTCPVHIAWPGIDWIDAARVLGQSPRRLSHWIKAGVFEVTRVYGESVGKKGPPVPYIWSRSPLDPNAPRGRAPQLMWGDMWHERAELLPDDYEATLRRIPQPDPTGRAPGGWLFQCPGRYRPIPDGVAWASSPCPPVARASSPCPPVAWASSPCPAVPRASSPCPTPHIITLANRRYLHTPCPRLCRALFLPLPCWTIADFRGSKDHIPDLKPHWTDILGQPPACNACWKIRYPSLTRAEGWNMFITHITSGLLTGREVERPMDLAGYQRRKA